METGLWSHPAYGNIGIEGEIAARVERLSQTTLRFCYAVVGPIDELVIPPPAAPLRADNLWKTTCFEAFLAPEHLTSYLELNFSPSTQWAAYDFTSYRAGMVQASVPAPPEIRVERGAHRLDVTVTLSIDLTAERYQVGLAAVIEERGGNLSYWALSHPSGAPDFHRRDCFVLELPPPKPA